MHGTQDMLLAIARYRSDTRERVIEVLRQGGEEVMGQPGAIPGGNGDGSIYATFLHLVDVEESWLHEGLLAEGWQDGPSPERYADFDAIAAIWAQTSADWIDYLTTHGDAALWSPFTTGRGRQIPTWMVAWHTFNHTTHHLAEIWTALTVAGIEPPELDPLRWSGEQSWPAMNVASARAEGLESLA
jgi:uncharacterized damage-inducible protein DinB